MSIKKYKHGDLPDLLTQFVSNPAKLAEIVGTECDGIGQIVLGFPGVNLGKRIVMVTDWELVNLLLSDDYRSMLSPPDQAQKYGKLLGVGALPLLNIADDLWKYLRKITSNQLNPSALPVLHHQTICDEVMKFVRRIATTENFELVSEIRLLTLKIIVRVLIKDYQIPDKDLLKLPEAVEVADKFLKWHSLTGDMAKLTMGKEHSAYLNAVAQIDKMIFGLIDLRLHDRAKRRGSREEQINDLLGTLLGEVESGQIDTQQARDAIVTLFIAGYETTAESLVTEFFYLAKDRGLSNSLFNELVANVAAPTPTPTELKNLRLNEAIFKEATRFLAPVPLSAGEANSDIVIGDYRIPKGSVVMMSLASTMHDYRNFPSPNLFSPSRFLEGALTNNIKAYKPFGHGPRVCVGAFLAPYEAQIITAILMREFSFSLVDQGQELETFYRATINHVQGPIWMRIERR